MPPPIDFSNPQSVAQGFQANAQITAGVARREPGVSLSAIPESLKPQVAAWTTNGPPQATQAILDAVKALPGPSRDATVADMKDSIISAAHSGDPTKAEAANSLMDQLQRKNPLTFEGNFGKTAVAELSDWNSRRQYLPPEQLAEETKRANDPAVTKARDALTGQANDLLKPITGKDIVTKMVGSRLNSWNPFGTDYSPISDAPAQSLGTLRQDYADAYKYQYGRTGDEKSADAFAMESLGKKWTLSPTNGDRLTPYAPETSPAYPQVNGSKDYIGDQLKDFMTSTGHPGAHGYLVSDARTDAEIHTSGQAPSYRVVALGNDGQFHALPQRFFADPKAAQNRANEDFTSANRPTWQGAPTWDLPGKLLPQGQAPDWGTSGQGATFGGRTW